MKLLKTKNTQSQQARLFQCLKENSGSWVAMPLLARKMSGTGIGVYVARRIHDLRRMGHQIETLVEQKSDKVKTFYKLNA